MRDARRNHREIFRRLDRFPIQDGLCICIGRITAAGSIFSGTKRIKERRSPATFAGPLDWARKPRRSCCVIFATNRIENATAAMLPEASGNCENRCNCDKIKVCRQGKDFL
jgi:hypothetical protein